MTIDLTDGKQVSILSDKGTIRLQINAYRGSMGVEISTDDAFAVAGALIAAVRKARRAGG